MLLQIVQFESALTETGVVDAARERIEDYRAQPGLVQKYYLKFNRPNVYGGVMLWESPANLAAFRRGDYRGALAAFRETELARTVGQAYRTAGAPDVHVSEVLFPLRSGVDTGRAWVA